MSTEILNGTEGDGGSQPAPDGAALSGSRLMEFACAYQHSEALRAALALDIFTAIGEGFDTPAALAAHCGASERGLRILVDYLIYHGLLGERDGQVRLTTETAVFLDRRSPRNMVEPIEYSMSAWMREGFASLTEATRRGGTALGGGGVLEPGHPVWLKYASALDPPMTYLGQRVAPRLDPRGEQPIRILDVAAGHGRFGLALAQRNPQATVVALDWPGVLTRARENAVACGVGERFETLEGNALEVDFGGLYDIIVVANFLAYLDPSQAQHLLAKVCAHLAPEGRAGIVGFVGLDSASMRAASSFSLTMLATTPGGQAFTTADLEKRCREAGFRDIDIHPLLPTVETLIVAWK